MKYVVTGPDGALMGTYERSDGRLQFWEPGRPYLAHNPASKAATLLDAVIEEHRRQGRTVSEE